MIPILMYHQVAEIPRELDPLGLAIPPDQFEWQMRYLARNSYQCLTLQDAVQYIRDGRQAPAKSFVLTFDDGYQDFYTKAYPIIGRIGYTATVFLVPSCMGSPSNWTGQYGSRSGMLLSWAEARDLSRRGIVMGSHTLSHPRLSLLDDQSAFEEIQNSKLLLQDQLNQQIDLFSYPYSNSDARIEQMVCSAGYSAACGGDSGHWNIFHLWRVPCLRDDTALSFTLKVNGWYNKRTALRESAPGRILRRSVRMFRRRGNVHHRDYLPVSNYGLDNESERRP